MKITVHDPQVKEGEADCPNPKCGGVVILALRRCLRCETRVHLYRRRRHYVKMIAIIPSRNGGNGHKPY